MNPDSKHQWGKQPKISNYWYFFIEFLSERRVIITHVPNTLKYTENAQISTDIQLLWSSTLQNASQPQDLLAVKGPNLQIRQDAPARGPDYNLILEFSNSTKSSTKARRTCAALRAQTPAGSSGWVRASRADRSQRRSEPAPRPDPHHRSPSHTSRTGSTAPHWHMLVRTYQDKE